MVLTSDHFIHVAKRELCVRELLLQGGVLIHHQFDVFVFGILHQMILPAVCRLRDVGIEPNGICFLRDKTLLHCDVLVDDNDWNFIGTHVKHSVLVTAPYNKDVQLGDLMKKTHSMDVSRVGSFHEFVDAYIKHEIKVED